MSNNPKEELSCKNLNELEDAPLIRQTERLQCLIEVFFCILELNIFIL